MRLHLRPVVAALGLRGGRRTGILLLAALLSPGLATAQIPTGPILLDPEPTLVKGGAGNQTDPHVSGGIVSYSNITSTREIRYQDLNDPSRPDFAIPNGDHQDTLSDVSGNIIVFRRFFSDVTTQAIMFYDIANPGGGIRELSPEPGTRRVDASIGGDTVAFRQLAAGFATLAKICVSSVSDPLAPANCLTDDSQINLDPAVSPDGATVAFTRCATDTTGCDIYVARRNVAGTWGAPQQITGAEGEDREPDTNGALVTWSSDAAGDRDIYYANTDGTLVRQLNLTDAPGSLETNPNISGDLIAFERVLPGSTNADLYLYQISTNTLFQLTDTPSIFETLVDISVNAAGVAWVVWAHAEGPVSGSNDVWATTFALGGPTHHVQSVFNQAHSYKLGRVVPIRLQLFDAAGLNVSSPSLVLTATALVQKDGSASPSIVEDAGNSNPDSAFRYDAALEGYAFNLSTRNLSPGTWELQFTVSGDTHVYGITFDVR